jgi:hypothetical protein
MAAIIVLNETWKELLLRMSCSSTVSLVLAAQLVVATAIATDGETPLLLVVAWSLILLPDTSSLLSSHLSKDHIEVWLIFYYPCGVE